MIATAPAPSSAPWPQGIDLDLLAGAGPLGLAVSGGGDSVALAVLLAEAGLPDLTILTVDHRLRPGSAADADCVEALARRLGLAFERLVVTARPSGSLQAFARAQRYELLAEAATRRSLGAVVTAHTLEDQAETFLLRLARGSGVRGLGAMHPVSVLSGLTVLRPLLGASRADLREALSARGIDWREDPSNADPRFDRIAMRRLAPQLAAVGLTGERLASAAKHLRRAGEALDTAAADLRAHALRIDLAGGVHLRRAPLIAAPREVRLRVLADAVALAGGSSHPPRFSALEEAETCVARGAGRLGLGRAILDAGPAHIRLWREARDIESLTLAPGEARRWDGRYLVRSSPGAPEVRVGPLGPAARGFSPAALKGAIAAAPAVFSGGDVVAAPTLGLRRRDWPRGHVEVRTLAEWCDRSDHRRQVGSLRPSSYV